MIRLFYCKIPKDLDCSVIELLSKYRQDKLLNLKADNAIKQGVCAELLLETAVEGLYSRPLPIVVGPNGKPYFSDGKLFFSISHSADYVACAVYDREVGMDIQKQEKYNLKLAERYFTDDEKEYIGSSPDKDYAFTDIWCKKESRLKASGIGLKGGLNSFSVLENPKQYICGDIDTMHFAVCVPGCDNLKIQLSEIKLL